MAQGAAEALKQFETALKSGGIADADAAEINRHAEAIAAIKAREYETALGAVNETMRAETRSEDPYVRRMRPPSATSWR